MPAFRFTFSWAVIAAAIACSATPSLGQWTPPMTGLIPVGMKTGAGVASKADSRVGPTITINQPSSTSAFWSLTSKNENSVSVNMMPYGLSGHTVLGMNQQSSPVSWNVLPMLDAHCNASWQGYGYINGGTLSSESGFDYQCKPTPSATRKVAWVYLTAHGSPNVFMGTASELMRVDLGRWFVNVVATSPSASTPSRFVIQTFLPTAPNGSDALETSAPMDIVNHLLLIEFPANSTFTSGVVRSKISGCFNRLPTGSTGSGQKILSNHTWIMWDNAPRTSKVLTINPANVPVPKLQ